MRTKEELYEFMESLMNDDEWTRKNFGEPMKRLLEENNLEEANNYVDWYFERIVY